MTFIEKLKKNNNKWCLLFLTRSLCTCPDVYHKDEKHLVGRVHVHEDFISVQAIDNCWINIREDMLEAYEVCKEQAELDHELHKNIQKSKMHIVPKKTEKIIIDGERP